MRKIRVYDFEDRKMWIANDYEGLSELFGALNTDSSIFSEPMQSTGLFDVNGKEIFEGDVIVAMSQGVKATGEVKRRIDGYWLMYPSFQKREFWHIVENVDTGETGFEIIGDIYRNPELVEVNNE